MIQKCLFILVITGCCTATYSKNIIIPEVIKSKKNQQRLVAQSAQVTKITQATIKESPAVDLPALLQQQQSVARFINNSVDNSQTAVSIRGFGDNASANSLILINGFPLTNQSLLAPNINSIALLDIASVNIIQGSEGVLAGDQAVGGVVNIITRQPKNLMANTLLGLGNYNKKIFNALVGNQLSSGIFLKIVGFVEDTKNFRKHNEQTNYNLRMEGGYEYSTGTFKLHFQAYDNRLNFPGGLTAQQFAENRKQATTLKNFVHSKIQLYQLLNKQTFNANWLLETRLSLQNIAANGYVFMPSQTQQSQIYFEPRLIGQVRNNKLIFGYFGQASHYKLWNRSVVNNAQAEQNNFYAHVFIPLQNNIKITLGGRNAWQQNNFKKFITTQHATDRVFVTELGTTFVINNKWQTFIRRSGNFRFPKANELTWNMRDDKVLTVQDGVSYEAGSTWLNYLSKTQLNIYQLDLHNEILFDPTQTIKTPFGSFTNIAHTQRRGVTIAEYLNVNANLELNAQVNYVNAKFSSGEFAGKQIPGVADWNGNAGVNFRFIPNWFLKYYVLYTGARFPSQDNANRARHLSSYWLHTAALQYMAPHYSISLEVNNLFNQSYSAYTLYNSATGIETFYPGLGRSVLLSFKAILE